MQKVMFIILSILVLPVLIFAQGTWISFTSNVVGTPPIIEVLESNNSRTAIHVTIPGMWAKDTLINGTTYQILKIPDYGTMHNAGEPQLPAIRKLVAIPPISNANISVTSTVSPLILNGYMVYPHQAPVPEGEPPGPFIIDTILYATDFFYPGNVTELSDPAVWRDVRVVHSSRYPITFNPVTHQLNVCYDFTVVLDYWGVSNINVLTGGYPAGVGPQYASMYRNQIINYDWLGIQEDEQYCDYDYLVITTSAYYNSIQPFVFWKTKKGFKTEVEVISPGLDSIAIKRIIKADYVERKTEWVLFVGDHPDIKIPKLTIGNQNVYSDYWYTLLTGEDDYPELTIGRFSPFNDTDVTTMANKTFAYERNPCAGWDMDEVLLVVAWNCWDSYSCKQYIRTEIMEPINFAIDTAYAVDNNHHGNNETVKCYIQDSSGVGIVNFRGHGSYDRWLNWTWYSPYHFTTSHVGSLNNFWYPDSAWLPLVFNFCCSNGAIQNPSECMVEAWTRADTGGAVGALGATGETYWEVSNPMDTVLFAIMFDPDQVQAPIYEIGKAIDYAKVWVINNPPCPMDSVLRVVYRHLWAGDPSLWVWTDSTGILASLTVTHPTYIETQRIQFTVTVKDNDIPVQGAFVCLYKELDIYERGRTNERGMISFDIEPVSGGYLYVTVTNHHALSNYYYNYCPYEGTCEVSEARGDGPMSSADSSTIPKSFAFGPSYPNPFGKLAEIRYQTPETEAKPWIYLKVYDISGRLVRTLIHESQEPGYYRILWDGKDDLGKMLPAGIYFYYLEAGDFTAMRKTVLMR